MLAHELRNPLAPMANAIRVIQMSGDDPPAVRHAAEMMERQIAQMVRLVDDLLDMNRISRGTIELRKAPIELGAVVAQAVEAIRPHCESRAQRLEVSLPHAPVYLFGDPARLAQVAGNLLGNATKFTADGGEIGIALERDGDEALLRVWDNGIGIPTDQISRIFDMFVQVDPSMARLTGGIGMGLTLVRELVELHEGRVEARSSGTGRGSEFRVWFPTLPDVLEAPPPASKAEPVPIKARRVLVVDDNRDAADSLAMILQLHGHDTEIAYDGEEAIERAAAFRPELLLLDLGLPKLDGYEVARRIRERSAGSGVEFIALTGWGSREDRERSAAAGFRGHLVKPVRQEDLLRLLAD